MSLKTEAIGLAVMTELPLVIVNVQRGGPSTGLPTRIEQADLLQAVYGRHGECPVPVIAPRSPADCFDCAIEACPDRRQVHDARDPAVRRRHRQQHRAVADPGSREPADGSRCSFRTRSRRPSGLPARRAPRPGVGATGHPGTRASDRRPGEGLPDGQHLERPGSTTSGWSSCGRPRSPAWRATSRRWRSAGATSGDLLVVGWGSTYGAIEQAVTQAHAAGVSVAARPPPAPQSVPGRSGRGARPLPPGARPGAEPGPARPAPPRPVSRRRRRSSTRSRVVRSAAEVYARIMELAG